tara:strand:+ start:115 stop:1032 length:918 start_codon:yes stop_codon:yes gene_type:complete
MSTNQKILVIIAFRGIGDLIYHLPLLRSLHATYKTKLTILSNKVNNSKQVYKNENFYRKILTFDNTRLKYLNQAKKAIKFKKLLDSFKCDKIYLTSNATRLVLPVLMSNAKEKIIFGKSFVPLIKQKKYKKLTSSKKLFSYTKELNLKKKIYNFNLKKPNLKKEFGKKILVNVDSHHNQNNWNLKNYIELIKQLLQKGYYVYINFKKINNLKKKFPRFIINSNKVKFTHKKTVLNLINIINQCKYVVGNESGPICLGASLKKKIHAIYLPIHTEPESKLINSSNKYYNVKKLTDKKIINKIIKSL